jgi:hypothetical protein
VALSQNPAKLKYRLKTQNPTTLKISGEKSEFDMFKNKVSKSFCEKVPKTIFRANSKWRPTNINVRIKTI